MKKDNSDNCVSSNGCNLVPLLRHYPVTEEDIFMHRFMLGEHFRHEYISAWVNIGSFCRACRKKNTQFTVRVPRTGLPIARWRTLGV